MTSPNMEPVESSFIARVGYRAIDSVLDIEFKSGARWRYRGVEDRVFAELMIAGSVGGYYSREIRGQYDSERVDEMVDEKVVWVMYNRDGVPYPQAHGETPEDAWQKLHQMHDRKMGFDAFKHGREQLGWRAVDIDLKAFNRMVKS